MKDCAICKNPLVVEWTDSHGQGRCVTCNAIYKVYHYDENDKLLRDKGPELSIKELYIPYVQQYWDLTSRRTGLGSYLGRHPNLEDVEAFYDWLDVNFKKATKTQEVEG